MRPTRIRDYQMKKFTYYILTLILALALGNVSCNSDKITPEPDPEIPVVPVFGGNVGPRANTADDPANGIYVSPTGNDATGTGTIDNPYKSINFALGKASPGATIILRGGTYREGASTEVRVRQPNITIKSAKGEWAHIDLPFPSDIKDENDGNSTIHFDPEASGCKLQSIEVTGGFYTVCMETKWGWGGDDDKVAASNIIIEDCVLHDSRFDVVKVKPNCNNITIRFNEIYNSGRAFVGDSDFDKGECNAEGIDNVKGDKMLAHNNYIHDIVGNGIYAKGGATDVIIENNIVERPFAGGIMIGFDTSPDYFDIVENPDYYENIRGIVRNNLIIDAGWEGIGLYASKDAEAYNNTIVNAVCGVMKYHSPIYFGIATQDWENPDGCPPNIDPNIHHNLVNQPSTYNNRMIDVRYIKDFYNPVFFPGLPSYDLSALNGNPTMNNNCYYVTGKSATFTDNRPPAVENMGLSEWKTHISCDNGSIEVDPALDANYIPTNSQCTGMGILYPLILHNFTGITEPIENQNITVYPNPTNGELRIESGDIRVESVDIFDIYGKNVGFKFPSKNLEGWQPKADGVVFNFSHFPAGVYFLKIHTETGITTKKIIKN